jgi:hypothetical protein
MIINSSLLDVDKQFFLLGGERLSKNSHRAREIHKGDEEVKRGISSAVAPERKPFSLEQSFTVILWIVTSKHR